MKEALKKIGVTKGHNANYIIKDLLGDEAALKDESDEKSLEKVRSLVELDEDVVCDLRINNRRPPRFDEFWDIVDGFLNDKTAVDDRRHSQQVDDGGDVLVNLAISNSYAEFESMMKNKNTTDEIRSLCNSNADFKKALEASLKVPADTMKDVFRRMSLKDSPFEVVDPASEEELRLYSDALMVFGENIGSLTEKKDLNKFPLLKKFLETHAVERTYYFQVFKCNHENCTFHKPLRGDPAKPLGDPVPYTDEDGTTHFKLGLDPEENFLPSKLEDITKQSHGIDFSPSAQTAGNVNFTLKYSACKKQRCCIRRRNWQKTRRLR